MFSYSLILSTPLEIIINFIPVCVYIDFSVKAYVTISLIPSRMGSESKGFSSYYAPSGTI